MDVEDAAVPAQLIDLAQRLLRDRPRPVGLLGDTVTIARVRGVIAAAIAATSS